MKKWKIEYYEVSSGRFPAKEFIDNLEEKSRSKAYYSLELLTEFGVELGLPHAKKIIGTDLWELRVLGEKSLRIFYVGIVNKTFLLLHGFVKKEQKTPKKELKLALDRLKDYRRHH